MSKNEQKKALCYDNIKKPISRYLCYSVKYSHHLSLAIGNDHHEIIWESDVHYNT